VDIDSRVRKIIKTRGYFPTDEVATKLIWLVLRDIAADWERATHDWKWNGRLPAGFRLARHIFSGRVEKPV
jgi:transposase-like protein